MKHPTAEQIRSFAAGGELPEQKQLRLHIRRCRRCSAEWLAEVQGMRARGEAEYDGPVDRAIAAARRAAPAGARQEAAADATLAAYLAVVDGHDYGDGPALSGWPLCRKLLELSNHYRHRDAGMMLRYANCALSVSGYMDAGDYPAPLLADFQARIAAEVANAYRVNDVLYEADDYMQRAEDLMADGTGDVLLRARILDLKASLRNAERRFEESRQCLRAAQPSTGVPARPISPAAVSLRAGSTAATTAIRARPAMGGPGSGANRSRADPNLLAIALHTRVLLLNECERFAEARAALAASDLRRRYAGDRLSLLKLRWEEGRIAAGLGELAEAAAALETVRRGFAARELHYKAGLVALELAIVRLRQGRPVAELSPLLRELIATFRACGIDREAVGAVLLLRQACERERLSLELLRSVMSFLRLLERDPSARFELLPVA